TTFRIHKRTALVKSVAGSAYAGSFIGSGCHTTMSSSQFGHGTTGSVPASMKKPQLRHSMSGASRRSTSHIGISPFGQLTWRWCLAPPSDLAPTPRLLKEDTDQTRAAALQ